ncbi:hypothetical protein N7534_000757 [Penicillium rubens]|jgi:hypothetical protein|nr:hypothetical protein N7534_000757 [Penicillium rubens]
MVTAVGEALRALPEPDMSGSKHVEIRKKLWMVELHSLRLVGSLPSGRRLKPDFYRAPYQSIVERDY